MAALGGRPVDIIVVFPLAAVDDRPAIVVAAGMVEVVEMSPGTVGIGTTAVPAASSTTAPLSLMLL